MTDPYDLEVVAAQLGSELRARLAGNWAPFAVTALRTAISDLQGSISPQALPEMALRLAYFRLTGAPLDTRTADSTHCPSGMAGAA